MLSACRPSEKAPIPPVRAEPDRPIAADSRPPGCSAGSILHAGADLAGELEQALLDQDGDLAGERQRLLALGEDTHVPIVAVLGCGHLGARLLVACRLLPELADGRALPLDLGRARPLALL